MRKAILFLFTIIGILSNLYPQGEIDDQEKVFYRNERTIAFLLNTNGIGGNYRYAKRIDAFKKTLYEIEFNHLKHQKEEKVSIPSNQAINRKIVYGKLNYFYTLKGAIGVQKELFRKQDKGSISIRYFYNFGPSIGFLKPIYYSMLESTEYIKFADAPHEPNITGKAPFTRGISETSIIPGIYGKFGFTFEFSKQDKIFNALEAGFAFDAYIKGIELLYAQKAQYVIPTLFVSYRFGKVIDAKFNSKKSKIDNLLID